MENTQMIRLSVIVPVYNVQSYLRKCVDSLLCQDLPKDEYEIILVDDGSTDRSGAIADNLAQTLLPSEKGRREPFIYVIHQSNQGVAMARNNGVKHAHGEWVAFLDADDWWTPNHASKMLDLASRFPQAGLYACKYRYVKYGRPEDRITDLVWTDGQAYHAQGGYIHYFRSYYQGQAMPVWTGCVMMPKRIFTEMGGFPQGVSLGEDFLLWAKTALHYPVAYWDECLAYYNNDIPVSVRLTKKLHAPERHMLFRLDVLGQYDNADLDCLLDKLRSTGLLPYWLDCRYHDRAAAELAKINWDNVSLSAKKPYRMPVLLLKIKKVIMSLGSKCKQILYSLSPGQPRGGR